MPWAGRKVPRSAGQESPAGPRCVLGAAQPGAASPLSCRCLYCPPRRARLPEEAAGGVFPAGEAHLGTSSCHTRGGGRPSARLADGPRRGGRERCRPPACGRAQRQRRRQPPPCHPFVSVTAEQMSVHAGSPKSVSTQRPSLPVQGTTLINRANATRLNTALFHSRCQRKAAEALSAPVLSLKELIRTVYRLCVEGQKPNARWVCSRLLGKRRQWNSPVLPLLGVFKRCTYHLSASSWRNPPFQTLDCHSSSGHGPNGAMR